MPIRIFRIDTDDIESGPEMQLRALQEDPWKTVVPIKVSIMTVCSSLKVPGQSRSCGHSYTGMVHCAVHFMHILQ